MTTAQAAVASSVDAPMRPAEPLLGVVLLPAAVLLPDPGDTLLPTAAPSLGLLPGAPVTMVPAPSALPVDAAAAFTAMSTIVDVTGPTSLCAFMYQSSPKRSGMFLGCQLFFTARLHIDKVGSRETKVM